MRPEKPTEFQVHHMCFDLAFGSATEDQRKRFEMAGVGRLEIERRVQVIKKSMAYIDLVSQIAPNPSTLDLIAYESFPTRIQRRWYETSILLRWAIPSTLAMSIGLFVVLTNPQWFPWLSLDPQVTLSEVEIAEVKRSDVIAGTSDNNEESTDSANQESIQIAAREETHPAPAPESAEIEGPVIAAKPEQIKATTPPVRPKPKGFVYRAHMNTSEVNEVATLISNRIVALGGTKAGNVELGWEQPKGRYFHFSVGAEHYDEIFNFLQQFGTLRISKDPHPRVMPEGQIRWILWLEWAAGAQQRASDVAAPNQPPIEAEPQEDTNSQIMKEEEASE
ncbi:MAG: hypothetical protein COT74_05920 [Bdellovibrionales bacterium CG10_big_fil_rev_8_21_14_0_10_45_34]|nr:MAG: hypothetical protein COT74_05920 [Bdellovibrionales bacterium CG10_big_fil_rev_8_21_14_0_10_45_34]